MRYLFASIEWKKQRNLDVLTDYKGMNYYELFSEVSKGWEKMHERVLAGESIVVPKQFIPNFFGKQAWIEYILRPWRNLSDEIAGLVVYSNNITEKVNLENKIESYIDELSRSNVELERFAYVISHDLKQPLRSISNFASLLLKENAVQQSETSAEYLDYILKNAWRMDALIRDIFSYATLSNKSSEEKKVNIDTNQLLKDVILSLNQQISEANVQLHIAPLPFIFGHQTQIFQLFLNLISNAIKYRCDTRELIIEIFFRTNGDMNEFHVKDNGIGMEAEYHKIIFEFSKRLHSKTQCEGSGIGLTSCQKIVMNHNGTIGVNSEKGVGSDFYFMLPKESHGEA